MRNFSGIERTHDMQAVKAIMSHPRIWPHIHDDSVSEPAPADLEHLIWLLATDTAGPAAVFLFYPLTAVSYEGHVSVLPRVWGKSAEYARQAIEWMFANTPCERICGATPADNILALRFNKRIGFQCRGVRPRAFVRNGQPVDLVLSSVEKSGWAHA